MSLDVSREYTLRYVTLVADVFPSKRRRNTASPRCDDPTRYIREFNFRFAIRDAYCNACATRDSTCEKSVYLA